MFGLSVLLANLHNTQCSNSENSYKYTTPFTMADVRRQTRLVTGPMKAAIDCLECLT